MGGEKKGGNDGRNNGRRFTHRGSGFILLGVLGHGNSLYRDLYVQWIKVGFYCSTSRARNCTKPSVGGQTTFRPPPPYDI